MNITCKNGNLHSQIVNRAKSMNVNTKHAFIKQNDLENMKNMVTLYHIKTWWMKENMHNLHAFKKRNNLAFYAKNR